MLSVPIEVQNQLKQDGVHKEVVIHFPNGEYPDITNDDLISESVKFEESVCSQAQFKYGLAEASCLQFEFVNTSVQTPALNTLFPVAYREPTRELTNAIRVTRTDGELNTGLDLVIQEQVGGGAQSYPLVVGHDPGATSVTLTLAQARTLLNTNNRINVTFNYLMGVPYTDGLVKVEEYVNDEWVTISEPVSKYGNIKGMQIEAGVSYDLATPYTKRLQIPPLDNVPSRNIDNNNLPVINIEKATAAGVVGLVMKMDSTDGTFTASTPWFFDIPNGTTSGSLDIGTGYEAYYGRVDTILIRQFYEFAPGKQPTSVIYYELDTSNYSGFLNATETVSGVTTTLTHYEDEVYNSWTIPYGVFTVESCPRNHGNMARRKVTAYSQTIDSNTDLPSFERYKNRIGWPNAVSTYDAKELTRAWFHDLEGLTIADSQEGRGPIAPPAELDYVSHWVVDSMNEPDGWGVPIGTQGGGRLMVYPAFEKITLNRSAHQAFGYKKVRANITAEELRPLITTLLARYDEYGQPYELYPEDFLMECLGELANIINKGVAYVEYYSQWFGAERYYRGGDIKEYMPLPSEFLSWNGSGMGGPPTITLRRATYLFIQPDSTGQPIKSYVGIDPVYDIYAFSNEADIAPLAFNATLDVGNSISARRYYYSNSFSYRALLDGFLELTADYARPSRYGGLEKITMNDANPYRIVPSDYSDCWWEEYEVEPIGAIKYKFTANNVEQEVVYTVGDGTSIYDMGSNAFIDAMASKSVAAINSFLDTYFVPKLQYISFVPVELTMRALPFLEAGDCLEVEAQDGTIIKTYIMHQNIDGIQLITADITSTDGSVIDTDTNAEVELE